MMLPGFFPGLKLSETLDLLLLLQEKIVFIFLLLESFVFPQTCCNESIVINVVPFLHSSDCLGGAISGGFNRDALFLASSLSAVANIGWDITISLSLQVRYRALLFQSWSRQLFFV